MTLRDYFSSLDRFGVVPILGYAGLKIGGLTAQQCLHDPRLHAELVRSNLQQFEPDAVISLMDLTVEAESYGVNPLFSDYDPPEIRTYLPLDNVTASLHQTHTDWRCIERCTGDVPVACRADSAPTPPCSAPYALAVDASGSIWLSNSGKNTLTQFVGNIAAPVESPLAGPPQSP